MLRLYSTFLILHIKLYWSYISLFCIFNEVRLEITEINISLLLSMIWYLNVFLSNLTYSINKYGDYFIEIN